MMTVAQSTRTMSRARPVADEPIDLSRDRRMALWKRKNGSGYQTPDEPERAPAASPVAVVAEAEAKVLPFIIPTPRDELKRIIDLVARMHGATYGEVLGARRTHRICHARQAAVCAIKEAYPGYSLPQIGRLFGGKDHTTILHTLRRRGSE